MKVIFMSMLLVLLALPYKNATAQANGEQFKFKAMDAKPKKIGSVRVNNKDNEKLDMYAVRTEVDGVIKYRVNFIEKVNGRATDNIYNLENYYTPAQLKELVDSKKMKNSVIKAINTNPKASEEDKKRAVFEGKYKTKSWKKIQKTLGFSPLRLAQDRKNNQRQILASSSGQSLTQKEIAAVGLAGHPRTQSVAEALKVARKELEMSNAVIAASTRPINEIFGSIKCDWVEGGLTTFDVKNTCSSGKKDVGVCVGKVKCTAQNVAARGNKSSLFRKQQTKITQDSMQWALSNVNESVDGTKALVFETLDSGVACAAQNGKCDAMKCLKDAGVLDLAKANITDSRFSNAKDNTIKLKGNNR